MPSMACYHTLHVPIPILSNHQSYQALVILHCLPQCQHCKIPPLAVQLIANLLSSSQHVPALRIVAVDVRLNFKLQSA